MKQIKVLILFLLILALLPSCRGVKEKLSMKKKQDVDEFLIEKKNPLVFPPNYSQLPEPKDSIQKDKVDKKDDLDLSEIFEDSKEIKKQSSSNELEKSISNILNKK